MNITGKCCEEGETVKYPVTLPVDVLLNPIHFAWSLSFNVQNIHICWPVYSELHLLVGLILSVPQGDRQSKMKSSYSVSLFPDLPYSCPSPHPPFYASMITILVVYCQNFFTNTPVLKLLSIEERYIPPIP